MAFRVYGDRLSFSAFASRREDCFSVWPLRFAVLDCFVLLANEHSFNLLLSPSESDIEAMSAIDLPCPGLRTAKLYRNCVVNARSAGTPMGRSPYPTRSARKSKLPSWPRSVLCFANGPFCELSRVVYRIRESPPDDYSEPSDMLNRPSVVRLRCGASTSTPVMLVMHHSYS